MNDREHKKPEPEKLQPYKHINIPNSINKMTYWFAIIYVMCYCKGKLVAEVEKGACQLEKGTSEQSRMYCIFIFGNKPVMRKKPSSGDVEGRKPGFKLRPQR